MCNDTLATVCNVQVARLPSSTVAPVHTVPDIVKFICGDFFGGSARKVILTVGF